ncbi:MAG: HlyD family efflux transporter periplasmic adaptor subunit [Bacillota bacterium]
MAIKSKFKFLRFLIIISLFFYGIYTLFVAFFIKENVSYRVKYQTFYLDKTYDSLIVRNEKIFISDIAGDIKYRVNEGEVVRRNQVIATLDPKKNSNEQKSELVIEDTKDNKEALILRIDQEIALLKKEIANKIRDEKYLSIKSLENELKLKLDLKSKIINNEISNYNSQEISKRNNKNTEGQYFYSNYAGVVSKTFDSLENRLNLSNLYVTNYENIYNRKINFDVKSSGEIKKSSKVYKIIDNYSFYIVNIIPKNDIKLYKKGDSLINSVDIEINGEKYSASVYDCFENFSNGALVLELNETFDDFYKKRKLRTKVFSSDFEGIEVKNSSIVSKNEQTGVYKKTVTDEIIFVPIKIIKKKEDFSIVQKDYFYKRVNEKSKKISSIKENDEIMSNGEKYLD